MSIVHITNASMRLIVRSLRNKKNNISREHIQDNLASDLEKEGIFTKDDLNLIYNTEELREIYYMKMVLKNFEELLSKIDGNKNIITRYVDAENKKYIHTVKAPSYHKNNSCEWMQKSFFNIEIPQNCLSSDITEKKVRTWINTYKNLTFYELNIKFMQEFNCSEGLKEINLANSGTIDLENYRVEFKEQATKYRLQLRFLLDSDLGKKIANYRYAPQYKIDNIVKYEKDINLHEPIVEFHTAKNAMQKILFDFYKVKYNADLSFNKTVLESIGFNSCKGCIK